MSGDENGISRLTFPFHLLSHSLTNITCIIWFFQYYKAAVSGTFVTILMEWKATEIYVFFILIFFTFQAEIQQFIQNSEALLLLCKYVQKDSRVSG